MARNYSSSSICWLNSFNCARLTRSLIYLALRLWRAMRITSLNLCRFCFSIVISSWRIRSLPRRWEARRRRITVSGKKWKYPSIVLAIQEKARRILKDKPISPTPPLISQNTPHPFIINLPTIAIISSNKTINISVQKTISINKVAIILQHIVVKAAKKLVLTITKAASTIDLTIAVVLRKNLKKASQSSTNRQENREADANPIKMCLFRLLE